MLIRLNGQAYDGINGLSNVKITYTTIINGSGEFSFTSDMVLTGEAYNYVRTRLIDTDGYCEGSIKVTIEDECCQFFLFEGQIKSELVTWIDGECELKVKITNDNKQSEALRCIKRNAIDQDEFVDGNGLTFRERGVVSLRFAQSGSTGFLNQIFGGGSDTITQKFAMCIPVIDYLQNVADHCGLGLDVDELFGVLDFDRLGLYSIEGGVSDDHVSSFQDENSLVWSGSDLLTALAQTFNMEWAVIGDNIYLGKDPTDDTIIDLSSLDFEWRIEAERGSEKKFKWLPNPFTSSNTQYYDYTLDTNDILASDPRTISIPFTKDSIGGSSLRRSEVEGRVQISKNTIDFSPHLVIINWGFREDILAGRDTNVSLWGCGGKTYGNAILYFDPTITESCSWIPNMYNQFWEDDTTCEQHFNITLPLSCDMLAELNQYSTIKTSRGDGRLLSYDIDKQDGSVTLNGKLKNS